MRLSSFAVFAVLAACAPVPGPGPGLPPGTVEDVTPGLNEIEPDLCKAADYMQYLGQPGTVLQGVDITRVYRVIPDGGIVSQEYSAGRINFWLGPRGDILRIGCG